MIIPSKQAAHLSRTAYRVDEPEHTDLRYA